MKLFNRKTFFLLTFVVVFMLSGCASLHGVKKLKKVYVTNRKAVELLPLEFSGEGQDALYELTAVAGGESFSMLLYLQSDKESLSVDFLNSFGTTMGTLFYDGSSVESEIAFMPAKIPPEYLVFDLQLLFYDADAVKACLDNAGIKNSIDGTGNFVIADGEKQVAVISRDSDSNVTLKNFLRGYEYSLTKAE